MAPGITTPDPEVEAATREICVAIANHVGICSSHEDNDKLLQGIRAELTRVRDVTRKRARMEDAKSLRLLADVLDAIATPLPQKQETDDG